MKIGLALSSGSVRGLSHIGVLKVLEKNKIRIDYIAGSSVGAVIAALYASGISAKELEEISLKTDLKDLADFTIPYEGLIKGDEIENLIKRLTKDKSFSDLKIPLSIVATDIKSGKKLIINKGSLAKAVRASISIPAIFKPYIINKRVILDGGITDPLPVDVVKKMGADFIIAVDATPSFNHLNTNSLKRKFLNDECNIVKKDLHKDYLKTFIESTKKVISNKMQSAKLPYPLALVLDSIALMEKQMAIDSAKRANLVIIPDIPNINTISQSSKRYYIKQGELAAQKYTERFIKLRSLKKSK